MRPSRLVAAFLFAIVILPLPSRASIVFGSISGKIFDPNGNPFKWGCITAIDTQGNDLKTVSGGDDGSYLIDQLLPGDYRIRFQACYRWQGPEFNYLPVWFDEAKSLGSARQIVVSGSTVTQGIDGRLDFGASIGGVVKSEQGAPVTDITVEAFDPSGAQVASVPTDENGSFLIQDLDRGFYRVAAENWHYSNPVHHYYERTWYGGAARVQIPVTRGMSVADIDLSVRVSQPPTASGRAEAAILSSGLATKSSADTGEFSTNSDEHYEATDAFGSSVVTLDFGPGRAESSSTLGNVAFYPAAFRGLQARAIASCVDGASGSTNVSTIGGASIPNPIPPNTEFKSHGGTVTLNYQYQDGNEIDVAAIRFVDSTGHTSYFAHAHAGVKNCP